MPTVTINGTNNIWFQGVSLHHPVTGDYIVCPSKYFISGAKMDGGVVCPVLYICYSYAIQVNQVSSPLDRTLDSGL